eukprot:TRINITY_DN1523_c0_g1_i1.p1 TRINITY_DN1523_c0_g1~~TRINITY_DN1523_c0_g1_i1.p1  ORF type:complete len:398 (-),score=110.39 TRINITY_DN1523_c0_g1_i1:103-1296(-)
MFKIGRPMMGSTPPAAEIIISKELNKFTSAFLAKATAKPDNDTNVFLSPYNIFSALAMLLVGVGGDSRKQLLKALNLDAVDEKALNKNLHDMNESARSKDEGEKVSTAASAWVHQELQLLPTYIEALKKTFESDATVCDFSKSAEATKIINDWVSGNTNNLIKDLIPPTVITPLTRLVLVSAIHFKGTWAHPFKTKATEKADFICLGGKKTSVKMMSQVETFASGSVKDFAGLALPYAGGNMSMVLLLPKGDSSNIHALAADGETLALAAQNYSNWTETKTHVKLPKFKIEFSMDACDAMKQLGATDLFDEKALDLSNMLKDGRGHGLYVSAICHKAFVDVNEEGTEAAAATAVVMAKRGRPAPPPEFFCDRPFVFLICRGKTILFVGKLMKPVSEK